MLLQLRRLRTSVGGGVSRLRAHWLLGGVLGAYAATVLVVPVMVPAAVNDDWIWTRSVEILLDEGRFDILEVSAPSALFQVLWAAPFVWLASNVFGAVRLATVTFVLLTGGGLYALCHELGLGPRTSALGTAAFLFSPLVFVLSYTFMTDPYSAGFLVIAAACYARGIRGDPAGHRFLWWGSVAAAVAYLQRATGVLVPVGIVAFLVVTGRVTLDRNGAALLARVAAVPAAVAIVFTLFGSAVVGESATQELFREAVWDAGWGDVGLHAARMAYVHVMYVGLFALPLVIGALPAAALLARQVGARGWLAVAACALVVVGGLAGFSRRLMPSVPQFVAPWGLGPFDIPGDLPVLLGDGGAVVLTLACAVSALLATLALAARAGRAGERTWAGAAGLVAVMVAVQAVATAIPSLLFAETFVSLDRYLVPLVPLVIALTLWALQGVRVVTVLAWVAVGLLAVVSVVGTRDHLRFQHAVWDLARHAETRGVDLTELVGGYSWDGYHLHERSPGHEIQGPGWGHLWWLDDLFAPATDYRFVVAGTPLDGHTVVEVRAYRRGWRDFPLYLLERDDKDEAAGAVLISAPPRPPV